MSTNKLPKKDKKQPSKEEELKDEEPNQDVPLLPPELIEVIEDIEEPKKARIIDAFKHSISYIRQTYFSGPLPPPEILEGYNNVVKDGAERILSMAENQQKHRIFLESTAVKGEIKQSGRGQIFGFIIGVLALGIAVYLAISGHDVLAGIFASTTIVGLVTVFVVGKRMQVKDLQDKD